MSIGQHAFWRSVPIRVLRVITGIKNYHGSASHASAHAIVSHVPIVLFNLPRSGRVFCVHIRLCSLIWIPLAIMEASLNTSATSSSNVKTSVKNPSRIF